MNKYQTQKERARTKAQEWQTSQAPKSWGELYQMTNYFERLAKRYGLIKEFKNEGII